MAGDAASGWQACAAVAGVGRINRKYQLLRDDDARLFALRFPGLWKLTAQEFDEAARSRPAVRTQQAHAVEKNSHLENGEILNCAGVTGFRGFFLNLIQELREREIKITLHGDVGNFLVEQSALQRFVGSCQRGKRGDDIGISCGRLAAGKFGDFIGDSCHQLLMRMQNLLRDAFLEERRIERQLPFVFVLITVRRDQVRAIRRTVDGHFALRAAADSTDFFAFGRTVANRLALFTNRTVQWLSPDGKRKPEAYARPGRKQKPKARSGHDDFFLKAPSGDNQQKRAHGEKGQPVDPQVSYAGTPQDHTARNIDEIACRDEIADHVEKLGHGLTRKNVTRKKDTRQDGKKSQLHGL